MTDTRIYVCPAGCDVQKFEVSACCLTLTDVEDVGVLVDQHGKCTNEFADGIVGVPKELADEAEEHIGMGCGPVCPLCGDDAVLQEPPVDPETKRLNEMQEDRKTVEALAAQYWQRFGDEDRAVVRMGMIPAWAPEEITKNLGEDLPDDFVRLFAVAIMGQAERDGGMRA